jgi:hypothetical protein
MISRGRPPTGGWDAFHARNLAEAAKRRTAGFPDPGPGLLPVHVSGVPPLRTTRATLSAVQRAAERAGYRPAGFLAGTPDMTEGERRALLFVEGLLALGFRVELEQSAAEGE